MTDSKLPMNCKVSSTLNNDVKSFGKNFMFDDNDETCWNSDQGAVQWILLKYNEVKVVSGIEIQFQGGFAASDCIVEFFDDKSSEAISETIYFNDTNSPQKRFFQCVHSFSRMRINFTRCYDTYGRVIVYHLNWIYPPVN